MSNWYITPSDNDLMHYGILGMKWGVRRYQNSDGSLTPEGRKKYGLSDKKKNKQIDRITLMYNRANKWTNRKIEKLDAKGKIAKADVMRVMRDENNKARNEKIKNVKEMELKEDLSKSKRQDLADVFFGGQKWMANNAANMTTFLSRFGEYNTQRGMRWMSNFTLNKTLSRMSPKDGYDYLKRKTLTTSAEVSINTPYGSIAVQY